MTRLARTGLAAAAGLLVVGATLYAFRLELALELASLASARRYQAGPTQEIVWSSGADPESRAPSERPPNVVLILADDLGWYDTSVTGNKDAPTPKLQALADGGLRLDRHYVFRFCSPTRRSLLTGRFPTSLTTVQPDGGDLCSDVLPLTAPLLSEVLGGAGYVSHFVGKGHLGYETEDHLPVNRGFATHAGRRVCAFLGARRDDASSTRVE